MHFYAVRLLRNDLVLARFLLLFFIHRLVRVYFTPLKGVIFLSVALSS